MRKLKNKKAIIVILVFTLIFNLICFKANAIVNVEGNTTARNAFDIPMTPYKLQFKLETTMSESWYKIIVSKPSSLKVNIQGGGSYLMYELYDGKTLSTSNPVNLYYDIDFQNHYYKVNAGTYYIKFSPYSGYDYCLGYDYTLDINLLSLDNYEENDKYSNATEVFSGNKYNFKIDGSNDIDWFRIRVDNPSSLKVNVEGGGSMLMYQLYDEKTLSTSNPVNLYDDNSFQNNTNHYYKVNTGTYYIKFLPYDNYDNCLGYDYTLDIKLLSLDKYEENDKYSNATQVFSGNKYNFKIDGSNDIDWFKIKVDKPSSLKVNVEGGGLMLMYQLYDEKTLSTSNPVNLYDDNNFQNSTHYYKVNSGTYYIKFSPYASYERCLGYDYTLDINLLSLDNYEENDKYSNAAEVLSGNKYNFKIDGSNDVDWFKIKVDKTSSLKVNIQGGGSYLMYELYDEKTLSTSNPLNLYYDIDFQNHYYKVNAGTYYIKFSSYYNPSIYNDCLGYDYTLDINILQEDEYENNDSWQQAPLFPFGKEINLTINALNDVDWFKFELSEKTLVRLSLNKIYGNTKSFRYTIYDSSEIEKNSPSPKTSGTISNNNGSGSVTLDKGTYYIKLQGNGSSDFLEEEMKFSIYGEGMNVKRPIITEVTPKNSNVDIYSNIEIKFSKQMNLETIIKENFSIKCYNDPIDFDIDYIEAENKVVLKPINRLNFSSEYTVRIDNKVAARDNNYTMANNYEWTFTTREKRVSDDEVGSIIGTIQLPETLKSLVVAANVEIYSGSKKVKTVSVDRYGKFKAENLTPGNYNAIVKLQGFLDDSKNVTITPLNEVNIILQPLYGDYNNDGIVDIFDISATAKNYNEESKR